MMTECDNKFDFIAGGGLRRRNLPIGDWQVCCTNHTLIKSLSTYSFHIIGGAHVCSRDIAHLCILGGQCKCKPWHLLLRISMIFLLLSVLFIKQPLGTPWYLCKSFLGQNHKDAIVCWHSQRICQLMVHIWLWPIKLLLIGSERTTSLTMSTVPKLSNSG